MSSLNQCQFIGNLGNDPEIRTIQSGDKVANLSIGVSEKWKDKNTGEQKEKTEWVRVVIFGNLVKVAESYLSKGSKVYVSGKFQTRSWESNGEKKYSTEIVLQGFDSKLVMLDSKGGSQPQADTQAPPQDELEDEIPF